MLDTACSLFPSSCSTQSSTLCLRLLLFCSLSICSIPIIQSIPIQKNHVRFNVCISLAAVSQISVGQEYSALKSSQAIVTKEQWLQQHKQQKTRMQANLILEQECSKRACLQRIVRWSPLHPKHFGESDLTCFLQVVPMMYGFGDQDPAQDTVNVMEELLIEHITEVVESFSHSLLSHPWLKLTSTTTT